jgi:hypothetical protein
MSLFKYLRPTFEGKDGKASMKRLTIFIFVNLFIIAFFGDLFFDWFVSDLILELISTIIVVGILGNQAQSIASDFKTNKVENIE